MKVGTNSDVASVEVEIDSPAQRAGKEDKLRGQKESASPTGTGASQTLKTNNSSGNWFLEHVTVVARGTSLALGAVSVEVQVRDANGDPKGRGVVDPAVSNVIPFHGDIIKPGWDVHMEVTQEDANSYTVDAYPTVRQPRPDSPTTATPDLLIHDFEGSSPLSAASNDTADFAAQTSDVYHGEQALEMNTADDSTHRVFWAESDLDNIPERGDEFEIWVATSDVTATNARAFVGWCRDESTPGSPSGYAARLDLDQNDLTLYADGVVQTTANITGFEADTWYAIRPDFDSDGDGTISVDVLDAARNVLGSDSFTDTEFDTGDVSIAGRMSAASEVIRYDYWRQV